MGWLALLVIACAGCLVVETSGHPESTEGIGAKVTCVAYSHCGADPWTAEVTACAPDVVPSDYVQQECDAFVREACPSRRFERGVLCDADCARVDGLCRVGEIDFSSMIGEQEGI